MEFKQSILGLRWIYFLDLPRNLCNCLGSWGRLSGSLGDKRRRTNAARFKRGALCMQPASQSKESRGEGDQHHLSCVTNNNNY